MSKSLISDTVLMVALSLIMIYLNGALSAYDTNFFFLTRPPMEGLSYLNLDRGWYVYFIRLDILAIALTVLFHVPFIVRERKSI